MRADSKYQADIQLSRGPTDPIAAKDLEKQMGFNYRQAIGELIYAYTICRIDIAVPIITLSQFSQQPAEIHYDAVKQIFAYLNATKTYGLTYWRPKPKEDLPLKPDPQPITSKNRLEDFDTQTVATQLRGSCDATWGSDRLERR